MTKPEESLPQDLHFHVYLISAQQTLSLSMT
jgi:hypothetical protein